MAAKKQAGDSITRAMAALSKAEVQRLLFDPLDAKTSVNTGLKALQKFEAVLRRSFPGFNLAELKELPEICERLRVAQREVQQAGEPRNVLALVEDALTHRRALLPLAQSLAARGVVSAKALEKIERGSGQSDNLQDVLDLAALLAPVKTRVEAALGHGVLDAAKQAATAALAAQGSGKDDLSELTDKRDRLGTLVAQRHERLRAAMAAVTSMNEALTRVPSLLRGRPAKGTTPPVTPAT